MKVNDSKVWMAYAKSDLDAAHILLKQGEFFPRQICFMAQQAGEKALKAILVFLEINFPKTHDLDRLRELIPQGWQVKEKFPQLYDLSVWAVESRYPAHSPDVVENEARETLLLAESLFRAIEVELGEKIKKSEEEQKKSK
jgi:HEPN domain-containing protein